MNLVLVDKDGTLVKSTELILNGEAVRLDDVADDDLKYKSGDEG